MNDVKLPQISYLGFTAVTGEVHDNHDIISITTSTLSKAETVARVRDSDGAEEFPGVDAVAGLQLQLLTFSFRHLSLLQ